MPTNPKVTEEAMCQCKLALRRSAAVVYGDTIRLTCPRCLSFELQQARREGWEACREAAAKQCEYFMEKNRAFGEKPWTTVALALEFAAVAIRTLEYPEG